MRAAWWWIDRWRKSTAYTDLTLEEQGAYRNLLDELWLRGGLLPNDERILAKICGDALAWSRVRPAVLARFELTSDGWRNTTHDQVAHQAERRAAIQRRYRERRIGNVTGNVTDNGPGNEAHNRPDSPSPSPSLTEKEEKPSPGKEPGEGEKKARVNKPRAKPAIRLPD